MFVEVPPERLPTVPLTLLCGGLGAGKTTVLNHLIRTHRGARLGVLVNDFGEINVDAELVEHADGETIALANGCICCTILDDIVLTLFRLLHRDDRPEHVVIECSGVSDPASVLRGFEQARLLEVVRVDGVLGVVDAAHFGEYRDEPLALHQLVTSDLVVVNKVDLVTPAELAEVEARIRRSVPEARLVRACRGALPTGLLLGDLTGGRRTFAPPRPSGRDPAGHPWRSASHRWRGPLDPERLEAFVASLPSEVYRAKGLVEVEGMPRRRLVVQLVGRRVDVQLEPEPSPPSAGPLESVFVVLGTELELSDAWLEERLRACRPEPAETRPIAGLSVRWGRWWRNRKKK